MGTYIVLLGINVSIMLQQQVKHGQIIPQDSLMQQPVWLVLQLVLIVPITLQQSSQAVHDALYAVHVCAGRSEEFCVTAEGSRACADKTA